MKQRKRLEKNNYKFLNTAFKKIHIVCKENNKNIMKTKYILAIIGAIALIAIFTNPSNDDHKEAVKNELNSILQKNIKQESTETDGALQTISLMLGGVILDSFVDNIVRSENYILFSITKMSLGSDVKVVGIGAFGNVFISDKIEEAIEDNLQNN